MTVLQGSADSDHVPSESGLNNFSSLNCYVKWFHIPLLSWLPLFWTLSVFLCLSWSVEHRAERIAPDVL